jgi:hypothetical protein
VSISSAVAAVGRGTRSCVDELSSVQINKLKSGKDGKPNPQEQARRAFVPVRLVAAAVTDGSPACAGELE